ncbi:MAG: fibronectin type III domain-containing protein [Proteobacteria bacterium]|nr:fibronectin type III domain-containing protein [Pseudomonadota bacterium]
MVWFAVFLQSCSFHNESSQSTVLFESSVESISEEKFNKMHHYGYACLSYSGGDGIQVSSWQPLRGVDSSSLSLTFRTANLLGGYPYTFTVIGIQSTLTGEGVLKSPCPRELPLKEGWAQLGRTTVRLPQKAEGAVVITVPEDFREGAETVSSVTAPNALNASLGDLVNVTLNWDEVPEANTYRIRYQKDSEPKSSPISYSGTSYTYPNLAPGTYRFEVAAVNAQGLTSSGRESSPITIARSNPPSEEENPAPPPTH